MIQVPFCLWYMYMPLNKSYCVSLPLPGQNSEETMHVQYTLCVSCVLVGIINDSFFYFSEVRIPSSWSCCGIKVSHNTFIVWCHVRMYLSSLASVEPPQVYFDLKFPESVIEEVRLSSLQLEAVVYACQQHMNTLADGSRAGFLIGNIITVLLKCIHVIVHVHVHL